MLQKSLLDLSHYSVWPGPAVVVKYIITPFSRAQNRDHHYREAIGTGIAEEADVPAIWQPYGTAFPLRRCG